MLVAILGLYNLPNMSEGPKANKSGGVLITVSKSEKE